MKILWLTPLLVAVDQAVKLIIADYFMDSKFEMLGNVLSFRPFQNVHLTWFSGMVGGEMSMMMSVLINIISLLVWIVIYRLFSYWSLYLNRLTRIPKISFFLMFSAFLCSTIDRIFWGGSIDYIQLLDWFIFDLKDVYLSLAIALMFYFVIDYCVQYYKMPLTERSEMNKKLSVLHWVKLGLPTKPSV
jgi:signal peptidase II